jgi:hypothetical protein
LNEGQIPNTRVVRVTPGTGYHRVEGNRRASRNGLVCDLPPEILTYDSQLLRRCQVAKGDPCARTRHRSVGPRAGPPPIFNVLDYGAKGNGAVRGIVANRDVNGRDFGWGERSRAVTRRPPISLYTMVPRTGVTRTTLGFGIRPSFKGHFLSRRAKLKRYDSHFFRRCMARMVRAGEGRWT